MAPVCINVFWLSTSRRINKTIRKSEQYHLTEYSWEACMLQFWYLHSLLNEAKSSNVLLFHKRPKTFGFVLKFLRGIFGLLIVWNLDEKIPLLAKLVRSQSAFVKISEFVTLSKGIRLFTAPCLRISSRFWSEKIRFRPFMNRKSPSSAKLERHHALSIWIISLEEAKRDTIGAKPPATLILVWFPAGRELINKTIV